MSDLSDYNYTINTERKPFFFNFRQDGLASRLFSCGHLSKLINADYELHLHWPVSPHCQAHFLSLFKPHRNTVWYSKRLDESLNGNNKPHPRHASYTGQKLAIKNFLHPSTDVSKKIRFIKKKYKINKEVIGLHVRMPENYNWDHACDDLKNNKFTGSNLLGGRAKSCYENILKIENEIPKFLNQRILIASDSIEILNYFSCKYDNVFYIEEDILPEHSKALSVNRSTESVCWALAMAYILSLTTYNDKIRLNHSKSTYSRLPVWLHGTNL